MWSYHAVSTVDCVGRWEAEVFAGFRRAHWKVEEGCSTREVAHLQHSGWVGSPLSFSGAASSSGDALSEGRFLQCASLEIRSGNISKLRLPLLRTLLPMLVPPLCQALVSVPLRAAEKGLARARGQTIGSATAYMGVRSIILCLAWSDRSVPWWHMWLGCLVQDMECFATNDCSPRSMSSNHRTCKGKAEHFLPKEYSTFLESPLGIHLYSVQCTYIFQF